MIYSKVELLEILNLIKKCFNSNKINCYKDKKLLEKIINYLTQFYKHRLVFLNPIKIIKMKRLTLNGMISLLMWMTRSS